MRALVLAGGSGTRLRPITYTSAKQLVPVANKPVLFYGLEAIRDAGITEVGVVVGDTACAIADAVGDGSAFGLDVSYIRQEAPLGLAHAVLIARDFLGDEDFVLYLGDNVLLDGISALVAEFQASRPAAQVTLRRVPDPRQFGVAEVGRDGRITSIEEKPAHPASDLAVAGVYLFTPAIHQAVRQIAPSRRGELEIADAIGWLIERGHEVRSALITGYWKDTGSVADLLEVNRLMLGRLAAGNLGEVDDASTLTGQVSIGQGSFITRSRIAGPAAVGAGAAVTDSDIGPFTSVGPGCVITGSSIGNSIVLAGAVIAGQRRIEDSLVGRDAIAEHGKAQVT
jgi:glucose-1-phosphate thymidylyltransferase